MAAHGRHVGHYFQKNGPFLLQNIDKCLFRRSFHWSPVLHQQTAEANTDSSESIVIPKKKTWSKVAVLETLATTVNRDPTAHPYHFQDDPYLSPRTSSEFTLYSLAQESGHAAAKYFINNNPKFFTTDFAEPHIPCLMPESVSLTLEEVSEAALKERLSLRRVSAAVEMYDQLLQSGQTVSMETTHDLLDLICLYCDRNPDAEGMPEREDFDEAGEASRKRGKSRFRRASQLLKATWKENNNAERIFNLLPERDTRCYSALIRGMVKHGASDRAFSFYTDMTNNRIPGDVHIFNALISVVTHVREQYDERWDLIVELLNQMKQQKIAPTLQTFNAVFRALRRCGYTAKGYAPQTLSEMRHLGIAPSLASYNHVLAIFFRPGTPAANIDILVELLSEMEGQSFTCQDPDDVFFFCNAMKICLDNKDLELGYKLHALVEFGENWRLLGDPYQQSIYYGRFFNLLCLMEHVDVVMKWYRKLVPSLYYPNPQGLKDLLQTLDTDNRLDLLPTIWKDMRSLGHHDKLDLLEELLGLMSRDKHTPEVQQQFARCALEVKSVFDGDSARRLEWSSAALTHVTLLLLRNDDSAARAWEMLQLFKAKNRVPTVELMEEFLSACVVSGSCDKAVELVQTSASFCLPCTSKLTERALKELELSDEQRAILSELESAAETSD